MYARDEAKRTLHLRRSLQILKPSLKRLRRNPKDCSFLLGVAGPLALGAVVHHYLKNAKESRGCTEELKRLYLEHKSVFSQLPSELLYGHVGYLYSLLFVNCHVPSAVNETILTEVSILKAYMHTHTHTHTHAHMHVLFLTTCSALFFKFSSF